MAQENQNMENIDKCLEIMGMSVYEHMIRYDDGIKSDYVIASASVPL